MNREQQVRQKLLVVEQVQRDHGLWQFYPPDNQVFNRTEPF